MRISFANGWPIIVDVVLSILMLSQRFAVADFPQFVRQGVAINPQIMLGAPLNYPRDDAIFPSILLATEHFAKPLAKYYMYYGPHDPPGGIFMSYASYLNGPWAPYDADPATPVLDPVIARNWTGNYRVSHVASPEAKWIPEENKMFLWFHGENITTRYASSPDGLHFKYEGVAVSTKHFKGQLTDASYLRIARTAMPARNAKYVMTLMGNESNTRTVYLAWSNDARNWQTQRETFISPPGPTSDKPNIAAPKVLEWDGQKFVVYHRDSLLTREPTADLWATPVTNNFEVSGPPRLFFKSRVDGDLNRVASPEFVQEGDQLYMFYDSGHRLNNTICYATAPIREKYSQPIDLRSCSAKASSETNAAPPANAIDGDPRTAWSSSASGKQWLYVDLHENRLLERLRIRRHSNSVGDYSIYVGAGATPPDPNSALNKWDMVAKVTINYDSPTHGDVPAADHQFDFLSGTLKPASMDTHITSSVVDNRTGIRARYLMIYLTGTEIASINELELTQLVEDKRIN